MLLALIVVATASAGCGKIIAKAQEAPDPTRKNIQLTVYKEDFAVVKEDRPLELAEGTNRIGLLDVSKTLDQNSVMFNWPGSSNKPEILSSTYDLGVTEGSTVLKQFLGKPVDLVRYGENGKESERQHGILEVADPGDMVINCDGKYLINPQGSIEAPAGGIATIPQLSAEVKSPVKQNSDLALTYLTRGLSWSADYVATLEPNSDAMKLEVWASVTNQTGANFPNAKISFVAGSPNRAAVDLGTATAGSVFDDYSTAKVYKRTGNANLMNLREKPMPESVGELYAYPMASTASIAPNQNNRVKMLGSEGVTVKKDYSIALPPASGYFGYYGDNPNSEQRYSATLAISFKNTDKNGLGVPLPDGSVRVYEPGKDGSLAYIGAAEISDTPKKAGVYLTLTKVFDVYAQCKIAARRKVDKKTLDEDIEIPISNEKASAADVRLVLPLQGNWKIMTESDKSKKLDQANNQWTIHMNAGQEKTLKARIRFKV
ncbi:MAG TPA: DUF4139 domain-containing protein [Fimbriimonadaceae bacterium]|jgi:hypothetical protein